MKSIVLFCFLPRLAERARAWWVLKKRTHGTFAVRTEASPVKRGLEQLLTTTRRTLAIGDTRRSWAAGSTLLLHTHTVNSATLSYPSMPCTLPPTPVQQFYHEVTHSWNVLQHVSAYLYPLAQTIEEVKRLDKATAQKKISSQKWTRAHMYTLISHEISG